jgi:hypothetical protein
MPETGNPNGQAGALDNGHENFCLRAGCCIGEPLPFARATRIRAVTALVWATAIRPTVFVKEPRLQSRQMQ